MSELYNKYVDECDKINKMPKPFDLWNKPVNYIFRTIPDSEIKNILKMGKQHGHRINFYAEMINNFINSTDIIVEVELLGELLAMHLLHTKQGYSILMRRMSVYCSNHKLNISFRKISDNKIYMIKRKVKENT